MMKAFMEDGMAARGCRSQVSRTHPRPDRCRKDRQQGKIITDGVQEH